MRRQRCSGRRGLLTVHRLKDSADAYRVTDSVRLLVSLTPLVLVCVVRLLKMHTLELQARRECLHALHDIGLQLELEGLK
jgi:hypothetical protein